VEIGACVVAVDDAYVFGNEEPRSGTIASVQENARPSCFGADNWSHVLPVAPHEGEPPIVPPSTSWWRFVDDAGQAWLLGLAAPGLERLGVEPGDRVTVDWAVSWSGDWGDGAAVVSLPGRGRIIYALNEPEALGIEEGPRACARTGACSGTEWAMRFREGDLTLQSGQAASVGSWTFANGYAFTHSPGYQEPNEGVPEIPGCAGPITETFASGVVVEAASE
jgi:hypothetical protein